MIKYHFITFATPDYMLFAENNVKSALNIGKFDTATIYTMNDIDEVFKLKNSHIFKFKRGCGYWLWKPYLILKKLLEINENDVLCYNDSKYIWTTDVRKLEKDILINTHIGCYVNRPYSSTHIEKKFTKGDAFLLMNIPNNEIGNTIKNSNQFWAGFSLLRKNITTIQFIGEYLTYSQDYRIITDAPSCMTANDKEFIENRHDQAVFSLLCKKWNIQMNMFDKNDLIDLRKPNPELLHIVKQYYNLK
jgi:hypothetical protein